MLTELEIKNVAIIERVNIEFGPGFNVMTGETGAGKSILIDSINMALGGRTAKDLIRSGADHAFAQAVFEVSGEAEEKLAELEIETEDGLIILSRKITAAGKSTCRVNGRVIPLSVAREIGELLLTIHGQLDNQALLVPSRHRGFVDEFAGNAAEREAYAEKFIKYTDLTAEYDELTRAETDKEHRVEMLKFRVSEIEAAALRPDEEDELNARFEFLENAEKILNGVYEAYSSLYGDENASSAYDMLIDASRALEDAAEHDERLRGYSETVSSAVADIDDVTRELKSYIDHAEFEPGEIDAVQERLALISDMKRKFGCADVPEIIAYGESCKKELETIENLESRLEEMRARIETAKEETERAADILTESRREASVRLSQMIMKELSELDMGRVVFAVDIKPSDFTINGGDSIEFLISANPGEDLKPLSKIASGGEMSRIMLAIKSVLSKGDIVDTLIFDEIDTGVSGRAAQRISEKICKISREKQVLCITHLAQIASMGDSHYLIEKSSSDSETTTKVRLLGESERKDELSRIIGGVSVTDTTRRAAAEMLAQAENLKRTME